MRDSSESFLPLKMLSRIYTICPSFPLVNLSIRPFVLPLLFFHFRCQWISMEFDIVLKLLRDELDSGMDCYSHSSVLTRCCTLDWITYFLSLEPYYVQENLIIPDDNMAIVVYLQVRMISVLSIFPLCTYRPLLVYSLCRWNRVLRTFLFLR